MRERFVMAWKWLRGAPLISPRSFLLRAAAPIVCLGILHVFGAREFTGVLCLTAPPGWSLEGATAVGGAYALAWFLSIAVSPVLIIAAGAFWVLRRVLP